MTRTITDPFLRDFYSLGVALFAGLTDAATAADTAVLRPPSRVPPAVRIEIEDLIAECGWAYDTGHAADFLAAFTDDAKLELFGQSIPRAGLGAFLAGTVSARGDNGWQHRIGQHQIVAFSGTTCEVRSFFTMVAADPRGTNAKVELAGRYRDRLIETARGWRIRERQIAPWTGKTG